jgi:hypothetical protein
MLEFLGKPPPRKWLSFFLAAAIALLPGCSAFVRPDPAQTLVPEGSQLLPTRRCADMFLVDAVIDGRGPFVLLIDTGAAMTILTPEAARQFADGTRATFVPAIGATGQVVVAKQRIRMRTMNVGELELREFDALVLDLEGFETAVGGRLDGILGYPAFRDLLLTLDYPRGEVRVKRDRLRHDDPGPLLPLLKRQSPTVDLFIQGKRRQAILDSGSSGDLSLAGGDGLDYIVEPRTVGSVLALGGISLRQQGRALGAVLMGPLELKEPMIEPGKHLSLIGTQIMRHAAWTFDQRSQLVRIETAATGPLTFPSTYGIGVATTPEAGGLTITDVFPGLPAERAGLQVGDAIETLDGVPLLDLFCARSRLFTREGVAHLGIRRDGETHLVPVHVVVLVP